MNFITGNKFKNLADDFVDESKPFIDLSKKPKIIFLFTDWVDSFRKNILPKIDYQFKLITHNADQGVRESDIGLLEDNRLIRWFGMNCHIEHEKLTPIPIGIANEKWPHGDGKLLQKIIDLNIPKINRIYCNFDPKTNPIRITILNELRHRTDIDFEQNNLNQEDYWRKLASYKYVISPPGNSVDCHRIWESIYLRTIPICLNSIELKSFGIDGINSFSEIVIDAVNIKKIYDSNVHAFSFWESIITK